MSCLPRILVSMPRDVTAYTVDRPIMVKQQLEFGVYRTQRTGADYWKFLVWPVGHPQNSGLINDPVILKGAEELFKWEMFNDEASQLQMRKDITEHILAQAYRLPFPVSYNYHMWWPWVKQYGGEKMGYGARRNWFAYPWIDQDLKESMTGRR